MASYNDYNDSRPRPSRREYGTRQPREDAYLSSGSSSRSDRYSYDSRYDPRYSYPPPLPSDPARSTRPPRSPIRKRRSWPPAAIVESEAASLAKEAGSAKLLRDIVKDEAPSRGAVDQDPIIEDVPEYLNSFERRFVVVPKSETAGASSKGRLTPPTSEDEKAKRGRRRADRLGMNLDHVAPELEKRTASPYAFAKPTPTKMVPSAESYLSPDSMTPPHSDAKNKKPTRLDGQPSSPRRDSTRLSPSSRKSRDYFGAATVQQDDHAIDDYELDTSDSASGVSRRAPRGPRKPKDGSSQSSQSSQTSVVDFASLSLNGPPPRKANLDSRRQTESATSLPRPRGLDKSSRPSPLVSTSALSDLGQAALFSSPIALRAANTTLTPSDVSRDNSSQGSRNVSPATALPRTSASPPPGRSPRKAEFGRESSGSGPGSQTSSVAGSRPGTPPTASGFIRMPKMPAMPQSDNDWDSALAANARGSGPKAPSRLSTSMRMDSMPGMPRMNSATFPGPPRSSGAVPYPVEEGPSTPSIYMPAERDHQFFAPRANVLNTPIAQESQTLSRNNSPAPNSATRSNARPSFPARHSFANTSPIEARPPPALVSSKRPETQRKTSLNTVPPTKQEVEAMLAKGMPGCPRAEPVTGYDDWYTLVGAPNLDFCPDCISNVFERTVYRNSFRRSPPRSFSTKVQCAFSTPWIRLAWLLTLQERKPDLVFMRDLAEIEETSEPCPGDTLAVRSWYGLRDQDALFVRDFHICYADVRKVERLLPTLSGLFVRLPHRASYEKRKCALRTESNRFSVYCDKILDMHDKATASRKAPDPMALIDLVERKLRIRECERDNMLLGGLWHFIPALPEFTVCEDCYEEIVEPEVKKNSDVAMRFNRTVQPVYGEGIGTSCQLYSRRMRKVFKTAVKDNDLKYLARKAQERRDAELRLQERYRDILRQAKRLEGYGSEEDERRLERDLAKISVEWKARFQ